MILKGVQQERTITEAFSQSASGETLVNMMDLELLVGSGGVLSHAPRRQQAAMMLVDGFLPEGVTRLAVDSIFMMPQLGVLAEVHEKSATEVFDKDCLIHLGTLVAPVGTGAEGKPCVKVEARMPDGTTISEDIPFGEMKVYPLGVGEKASVKVTPARGFDAGAGQGKPFESLLTGGVVGLIIDTRGRPFNLPTDENERVKRLDKWVTAFDAYPAA